MKLESGASFWFAIAVSLLLHASVWVSRGRRSEPDSTRLEDRWAANSIEVGAEPATQSAPAAPPAQPVQPAAASVPDRAEVPEPTDPDAAKAPEPEPEPKAPHETHSESAPHAEHSRELESTSPAEPKLKTPIVKTTRPSANAEAKTRAAAARSDAPTPNSVAASSRTTIPNSVAAASGASTPSSADGASAVQSPAGSMGALELPPGVRHLAPAFTRALPASSYADSKWSELPTGSLGRIELEIVVDTDGHISEVKFDPRTPPAPVVERLVKNTVLLLKAGVFSIDARSVNAGRERLALEVSLTDEPSPQPEGDPRGLFRKGYEPPTRDRPGYARFTLNSGRHMEAVVKMLRDR